MIKSSALALIALCVAVPTASAEPQASYGPELEGFDYPFTVHRFGFSSQGQNLSMAFMEVVADRPNGRTIVLLHGKNFCAATWEATMGVLTGAGYRAIAPDQIGFCKSTKPEGYQYSFNQLAANTRALLEPRGVARVTVIGHSMGGMLAARYALAFPEAVEQLVWSIRSGSRTGKPRACPMPASIRPTATSSKPASSASRATSSFY